MVCEADPARYGVVLVTKDEFIAGKRDECLEDIRERYPEFNPVAVRRMYDAIAPKLMEGLEDSGEQIHFCSVHPGTHSQRVGCKLSLEKMFRLALPDKSPAVDECPECGTKGKYDGRVLVGGRGIYRCPSCGAKWQDSNEEPDAKGLTLPDKEQ